MAERTYDIRGELTLDEAIIISICTGSLCCPGKDLKDEVEFRLERKVHPAEFADDEFREKLQELYRPEFLKLVNMGNRIIIAGVK